MSDASVPGETWAEYLRRITKRPGWSVQKLADESGVNRSRLFKYLAGDTGVTIDTVRRIALAAGEDPDVALRAAARAKGDTTPIPEDEEVALIQRSPVDDVMKQNMVRKLYERREREKQQRIADFQDMIDLAKRED